MDNSFFGVVIKVENIDICRAFYRDVLELGPPILDSNFWVEFQLTDGVSLILEKPLESEVLSTVTKNKVAWVYKVDDIKQVISRLEANACSPVKVVEDERFSFRIHIFHDPEGNPFYLYKK
jgi:predicted enzyme related to lactoylglutathione lyase